MMENLSIFIGGDSSFNQKVKMELCEPIEPMFLLKEVGDHLGGLSVNFSEDCSLMKHHMGVYTIDVREYGTMDSLNKFEFPSFGNWLAKFSENKNIPITVLFIANENQLDDLQLQVEEHRNVWMEWQQFIHFMSLTDFDNMLNVFNKIINLAVTLTVYSSPEDFLKFDQQKEALFQKYGTVNKPESRNIVHLLAEMDQGLAFNKLADETTQEEMFSFLEEKDGLGKTPLQSAAVNICGVSLGAMLNFYAANLNMSKLEMTMNLNHKNMVDRLLHSTDESGKNLTHYIIQSKKKFLGPFGMILQFEKDFHMTKEESMKDYLEVQKCMQHLHGSTKETSLALKLMGSTIETTTASKWTQIVFTVLVVCLARVSLYLSDVVTDALVGNAYYEEWMDPSYFDLPDIGTLRYYPTQLTTQWKFTYTVLFMCLPCVFYFVELKSMTKFTNFESKFDFILLLILPITVPIWPIILMAIKAYHLVRLHLTENPLKLAKTKEAYDEISKRTGVVFLCEVCIQSSFQPILQWYILLPEFLLKLNLFLEEPEEESALVFLLSASFFFSVFSLAWSITSYSASLKEGALSITWDPFSRIVVFFSNLLLIFARINCIVLFMYYFGPGKFYPGMIAIFTHFLLMIALHCFTLIKYVYRDNKDNEENLSYFLTIKKAAYVSILNGLGNIFVNNFIHVSMNTQKYLGQKKKKSFYRQSFGDLIFLIENIIFATFGCLTNVEPLNDPVIMTYIIVTIFACHIIGLLLKIFYYSFLHIWKDLTVKITSEGLMRGNQLFLTVRRKKQKGEEKTINSMKSEEQQSPGIERLMMENDHTNSEDQTTML